MAVFEINEFPGSESRIDCAFFFGSSAGTPDADRELVRDVVRAGRVRLGRAGRRRVAPRALVSHCRDSNWCKDIGSVINYIPMALLAKRDAIAR